MRCLIVPLIVILTACGGAADSVSKVGGAGSASVISVSLNDAFTTVAPNGSEKVQLADARYFTPPASITALQGPYAGSNPGQYLHGKIVIGSEECVYQSTGITDTTLTKFACSAGLSSTVQLPAGTVIELVNYDASGYLLQADFSLVK